MSLDHKSKERQEMLMHVNQLLDEIGLTETVEDFLQSEYASSVIHAVFEKLEGDLAIYVESAPKHIGEKADQVKEKVLGTEEAFADEVSEQFKMRLAAILSNLEDFIVIDEDVLDYFTRSLTDDEEDRMIKQVIECTESVANRIEKEFFERCYDGYIPEGMPEEVAKFIAAISGGPIIPITAIFPDFSLDEDENSRIQDDSDELEE